MCCFKRPFDDQRQARIRREAEAVSTIIEQAELHRFDLIRSPALLIENDANPREDRRLAAGVWLDQTTVAVEHSPEVEMCATELCALGFDALDGLHVAYAEVAGARVLLTCDDRMTELGRSHAGILRTIIANPVDWAQELLK